MGEDGDLPLRFPRKAKPTDLFGCLWSDSVRGRERERERERERGRETERDWGERETERKRKREERRETEYWYLLTYHSCQRAELFLRHKIKLVGHGDRSRVQLFTNDEPLTGDSLLDDMMILIRNSKKPLEIKVPWGEERRETAERAEGKEATKETGDSYTRAWEREIAREKNVKRRAKRSE
jgi:hypothetical protein